VLFSHVIFAGSNRSLLLLKDFTIMKDFSNKKPSYR